MLPVNDIQKSTFVGFNIALLMYSVSIYQLCYYFRTFPKDSRTDMARNVSRRNVLLVASVILLSASEFVSSVGFIFGLRLPAFALRVAFSVTGVIADLLITGSVYYYLRPNRSGVKSIIALWLWITCSVSASLNERQWVTQGPKPPVSTPLVITSQSYVNSILAVRRLLTPSSLNARAQEPQSSHSPGKPFTFGLTSLSIPEFLNSRRKTAVCPQDTPERVAVA
ncbi:hypothetical protein EDD16DRAFT_1520656 [Pisolithus croceorrhizus]|nr:hypothetical protein EDD16DRAFT_1520656 [Pisolithus croceorrhizus]